MDSEGKVIFGKNLKSLIEMRSGSVAEFVYKITNATIYNKDLYGAGGLSQQTLYNWINGGNPRFNKLLPVLLYILHGDQISKITIDRKLAQLLYQDMNKMKSNEVIDKYKIDFSIKKARRMFAYALHSPRIGDETHNHRHPLGVIGSFSVMEDFEIKDGIAYFIYDDGSHEYRGSWTGENAVLSDKNFMCKFRMYNDAPENLYFEGNYYGLLEAKAINKRPLVGIGIVLNGTFCDLSNNRREYQGRLYMEEVDEHTYKIFRNGVPPDSIKLYNRSKSPFAKW